jgi:hypothetical protein
MDQSDLQQRATEHAAEAERLLAGRLGVITNMVKAEAHATLALYYATQAHHTVLEQPPARG